LYGNGNWHDGQEEELGFGQDAEVPIGGTVDMEDDVYLEFDEEEETVMAPPEPTSWKLLARYYASFRPNITSMFTHFADDVWQLRTGIRYLERGKNYYMITLFSQGDYDFVLKGGRITRSNHYEVWWERAAELPELIAMAWDEAGTKDDLRGIRKGLDSVMGVLQTWSKKKFGNLLHELDKCRK
jgi:hypothetical protein